MFQHSSSFLRVSKDGRESVWTFPRHISKCTLQPLRQTADGARRGEKVTHPDLISRKSELDTKRGRVVIRQNERAKSALH